MPLNEFSCKILPSILNHNHGLLKEDYCHPKKLLFLNIFTHFILVNTLASYDMHNSLILVNNVPFGIHQQKITFLQYVSSLRMLDSWLDHYLYHNLIHIMWINLVHLELYHVFLIFLDSYKHWFWQRQGCGGDGNPEGMSITG